MHHQLSRRVPRCRTTSLDEVSKCEARCTDNRQRRTPARDRDLRATQSVQEAQDACAMPLAAARCLYVSLVQCLRDGALRNDAFGPQFANDGRNGLREAVRFPLVRGGSGASWLTCAVILVHGQAPTKYTALCRTEAARPARDIRGTSSPRAPSFRALPLYVPVRDDVLLASLLADCRLRSIWQPGLPREAGSA